MSTTELEREAPRVVPAPVASTPWTWAERHPLATELEHSGPGAALAGRMARLEPADMDDAALVEAVAAWERLASWVAAGQGRAIAELSRRRLGERADHLADEVSARLSVTRAVADGKVALALELDRLPAVADALAGGALDVRRATVLAEELGRLPEHVAQDVAAAVLPDAGTSTAPQLRNRLRRIEILRDPDGATVRHRRACEQRRVELVPAPDAMAWLSAYLPAADAVAVRTALTTLATSAGLDADDDRTLDQRRADALVDLATQWLDAGTTPDGSPLRTAQGRRPHLVVTATAGTILGLEDQPAVPDGYGVVPPGVARRLAARSTWEPLLVDAVSGEPLARSTRRYAPTQSLRDALAVRDRTCTFPGCRVPAARSDIDHIEPFDHSARDARADRRGRAEREGGTARKDATHRVGGDQRESPSPGERRTDVRDGAESETGPPQTRIENLQALCHHHHRAKTHAGWESRRLDGGVTAWQSPTGQTYVRRSEWSLPDMHPPEWSRPDEHPPDLPAYDEPTTDEGRDPPPPRAPF